MTNHNRFEEIAERNSRSRLADVAFAAMVALLLVFCLASLRTAGASPLNAGTPTVTDQAHAIADHACFVEIDC